jgi:hypothetical protein
VEPTNLESGGGTIRCGGATGKRTKQRTCGPTSRTCVPSSLLATTGSSSGWQPSFSRIPAAGTDSLGCESSIRCREGAVVRWRYRHRHHDRRATRHGGAHDASLGRPVRDRQRADATSRRCSHQALKGASSPSLDTKLVGRLQRKDGFQFEIGHREALAEASAVELFEFNSYGETLYRLENDFPVVRADVLHRQIFFPVVRDAM